MTRRGGRGRQGYNPRQPNVKHRGKNENLKGCQQINESAYPSENQQLQEPNIREYLNENSSNPNGGDVIDARANLQTLASSRERDPSVSYIYRPSLYEDSFSMTQQILSETLGNEELTEVVKPPMNIDTNEWIAVSLCSCLNDVQLVIACFWEICTCSHMAAGCSLYLYKQENRFRSISSRKYIAESIRWIVEQFRDPEIFPSMYVDNPFPPNFLAVAQRISTLIFRIYAHMYRQHLKVMQQFDAVAHVNACFKYFLFLADRYDLLSEQEKYPLKNLCEAYLNPERGPEQPSGTVDNNCR